MDAFDTGFKETRSWLNNGSKGSRPTPDNETSDSYRLDWWRGSDKAFEFCAELEKQENVKVKFVQDIVVGLIYLIVAAFGVYLMFSDSMSTKFIGAGIFVFSVKNLFRNRDYES